MVPAVGSYSTLDLLRLRLAAPSLQVSKALGLIPRHCLELLAQCAVNGDPAMGIPPAGSGGPGAAHHRRAWASCINCSTMHVALCQCPVIGHSALKRLLMPYQCHVTHAVMEEPPGQHNTSAAGMEPSFMHMPGSPPSPAQGSTLPAGWPQQQQHHANEQQQHQLLVQQAHEQQVHAHPAPALQPLSGQLVGSMQQQQDWREKRQLAGRYMSFNHMADAVGGAKWRCNFGYNTGTGWIWLVLSRTAIGTISGITTVPCTLP